MAGTATSFISGDLGTAGNWTNGLPSAGNDGTIAASGTVTTVTVGGNVVHTSGDLVGNITTTGDITLNGSANTWSQSGGSVTMGRLLNLNSIAYTLSGTGVINFGDFNNGGRIIAATGSFTQSGGTINYGGLDANGAIINLSGGSITNFGNIPNQVLWARDGSSLINISGSHSIGFDPTRTTAAGLVLLEGGGTLNIAAGWTGSWTRDNFTAADWQTALTDTGTNVGGTQVTAGNFATLFQVTNAGTAGSSVALIPEPGTAALGLLGLLGLLRRRRG